jgi:ParB/RepB/Spo0J family partition protein
MADLATAVDVVASGTADHEPEQAAPDCGLLREYALVALDHIRVHPLNLRRELRDVEELADSIRQNGLLEPVLLVPDAESPDDDSQRFLLVAGHRRHAACAIAKHDPVEAIIRRDLDSDGAQVLAMLTENGPRDDLTAIEEAHGYQLALSLNHLTPAKLAKRLGKPRDKVTSRIALTRLPEHLQQQVHARQLGLGDAEAMVEFADDPEFLDSLLSSVGTGNFRYRVEQERRRREREKRIAALRRQLQAAGAQVIDPPQGYPWNSTEKPVHHYVDPAADALPDGTLTPFTPEAHAAACPLHAVFVHVYDVEPVYVCRDPAQAGHRHIHSTTPDPSTADEPAGDSSVDVAAAEAERLRQQEERQRQLEEEQRKKAEAEAVEAARREALEVAARLRRSFLATLVQRRGKQHLQAVLGLLLTENFEAWLTQIDIEDVELLGDLIDAKLPARTEELSGDELWDEIERSLRAALGSRRTPEAIAGALLAIVAHDREWTLAAGHGWGNASCRRYMTWLVEQGYELTDLERELLHDVEIVD